MRTPVEVVSKDYITLLWTRVPEVMRRQVITRSNSRRGTNQQNMTYTEKNDNTHHRFGLRTKGRRSVEHHISSSFLHQYRATRVSGNLYRGTRFHMNDLE
jgi:hypothetical protein